MWVGTEKCEKEINFNYGIIIKSNQLERFESESKAIVFRTSKI